MMIKFKNKKKNVTLIDSQLNSTFHVQKPDSRHKHTLTSLTQMEENGMLRITLSHNPNRFSIENENLLSIIKQKSSTTQ